MKIKLAALLLILIPVAWSAFAAVVVTTPESYSPAAYPMTAELKVEQVQAFTSQVSGVPTGKTIRSVVVQIRPDGTGRLIVNIQ